MCGMTLSAQAAVIAELTAENKGLAAEVAMLRAMQVIDAARIQRLLANQPVLRESPRMEAA